MNPLDKKVIRVISLFGISPVGGGVGEVGVKPGVVRRRLGGVPDYRGDVLPVVSAVRESDRRGLILVDRPMVRPALSGEEKGMRLEEIKNGLRAAMAAALRFDELSLKSRVTKGVPTRIGMQAKPMMDGGNIGGTANHVALRWEILDDGFLRVAGELHACGPDCQCKRRHYNVK